MNKIQNNESVSKWSKRLTEADFHTPHDISDEDFSEIVRCLEVPVNDQKPVVDTKSLRDQLNYVVQQLNQDVPPLRRQPKRKDDRELLLTLLKITRRAIKLLNQPKGYAAWTGLRHAGSDLGDMLSADWLTRKFPNLEDAPGRRSFRSIQNGVLVEHDRGAETYFVEDFSLDERRSFTRRHASETISQIFSQVTAILTKAIDEIDRLPPGDGKKIPTRHALLIWLAERWEQHGHVPATGDGYFYRFCHAVLQGMGLPTDGLADAIRDVVEGWLQKEKNLT